MGEISSPDAARIYSRFGGVLGDLLLCVRADNDTRLLHLLSLRITSTITSLLSQPSESRDVKAETVRHPPTKRREKEESGGGGPAAETFSPVIHDKLQITHFIAQCLKFLSVSIYKLPSHWQVE